MDTEAHQQHAHDNGYDNPNPQWVEMAGYNSSHQQSPLHEYGGFGFISPTVMPVEPSYTRSIPPPYSSHQQLQPLVMPQPTQWPSMMAGSSQSSYSPPALPTAPPPPLTNITPISATSSSYSLHTGSTPRKTLTDQDRRRMCLYHEENPTVKQTEIGGSSYCILMPNYYADAFVAIFGVERRYCNTVSQFPSLGV